MTEPDAPVTDLSKSPDRIAGMFDAIAARYDFLNHLLSAGIDRRWRRKAISALSLTGRERVLDLCTGTADLAIAAIDAQPSARAGDRRRFRARDAAGRARQNRGAVDRIDLVRGDATRIPLRDGAVDAITIGFGIRNVEDTGAACDEMRRVLAPGGRIAILEFAIPTTPGIRALYLWYFRHVLPLIGRIVSRHSAAYGYLPGLGRRVRVAGRVCDNPAAARICERDRRPTDLRRGRLVHGARG